MFYFIALVILQTILFIELGLLFLRVLGRRKTKYGGLGKSCASLQCFFAWLSRLIGYLFITLAAYVLSMGILQALAVYNI